jgi:hypothetical protein
MVPIQNVIQLVCGQPNVTKEIQSVAQECYDIADQTTLLCSTVQDRSIQTMIEASQTISTEMRSIGGTEGESDGIRSDDDGGRKNILDAKIFQKVQQFMDQTKTKQILEFLDNIRNDSKELQSKATLMNQSLQRGIDSLPSNMREEYDKDMLDDTAMDSAIQSNNPEQQQQPGQRGLNDGTTAVDISTMGQEEQDMIHLLNIDMDVTDLETSGQRGIMGDDDGRKRLIDLDFIKQIVNGSAIYEQAQQKGIKCKTILQQMRTLCSTITNLMQSFIMGGCCTQTMAVLSNIGNLFRCRTIVQLLVKAVQAIQRMIQAMTNLLQKAFQKIQQMVKEFVAAKKIGHFVTNVAQKTKVGQFTTNMVSNLADSKVGNVCSGIVTNIFK